MADRPAQASCVRRGRATTLGAMVPVLVVLAVVAAAGAAWWWRRRSSGTARIRVDPFTLGDPWRRHVQGAVAAERRYRDIVRDVQPGPLRDRLSSIGAQVEQAVGECYAIGRRGDELDGALARLDVASLDRQLQRASEEVTRGSLATQLAAAGRLRATRDDTDARLRLQVTRMGELVALAAEVSVGTDNTDVLGNGVTDVVTQLEGLRQALQEVQQPGRPATSP